MNYIQFYKLEMTWIYGPPCSGIREDLDDYIKIPDDYIKIIPNMIKDKYIGYTLVRIHGIYSWNNDCFYYVLCLDKQMLEKWEKFNFQKDLKNNIFKYYLPLMIRIYRYHIINSSCDLEDPYIFLYGLYKFEMNYVKTISDIDMSEIDMKMVMAQYRKK